MPLLCTLMSLSYCSLIQISNSLPPAFPSRLTPYCYLLLLLPDLLPLVYYFLFLLTHSQLPILCCLKAVVSFFSNKGLCPRLLFQQCQQPLSPHPPAATFVCLFLYLLSKKSLSWNIYKHWTK